jgi:hypothetical protein
MSGEICHATSRKPCLKMQCAIEPIFDRILASFFTIGIRGRSVPKHRIERPAKMQVGGTFASRLPNAQLISCLLARLLLLVIGADTNATIRHLVPALITIIVPAARGRRSASTRVEPCRAAWRRARICRACRWIPGRRSTTTGSSALCHRNGARKCDHESDCGCFCIHGPVL